MNIKDKSVIKAKADLDEAPSNSFNALCNGKQVLC